MLAVLLCHPLKQERQNRHHGQYSRTSINLQAYSWAHDKKDNPAARRQKQGGGSRRSRRTPHIVVASKKTADGRQTVNHHEFQYKIPGNPFPSATACIRSIPPCSRCNKSILPLRNHFSLLLNHESPIS